MDVFIPIQDAINYFNDARCLSKRWRDSSMRSPHVILLLKQYRCCINKWILNYFLSLTRSSDKWKQTDKLKHLCNLGIGLCRTRFHNRLEIRIVHIHSVINIINYINYRFQFGRKCAIETREVNALKSTRTKYQMMYTHSAIPLNYTLDMLAAYNGEHKRKQASPWAYSSRRAWTRVGHKGI